MAVAASAAASGGGERGSSNDLGHGAYAQLLQQCSAPADLATGRRIHLEIARQGRHRELALGAAIASMYSRCRAGGNAREALLRLGVTSAIAWTMAIAAEADDLGSAMWLFGRMQLEGIKPTNFTLASVLKACSRAAALEQGAAVHALLVDVVRDVPLATTVVSLYAACRRPDLARLAFDSMPQRNVVTLAAMLGAYAAAAAAGYRLEAMHLIRSSLADGHPRPDAVVLIAALSCCSCPAALVHGRWLHSMADELGGAGAESIAVTNAIINMYARCDCFPAAAAVFRSTPEPNVITWTSMIKASSSSLTPSLTAMSFYRRMQLEGVKPNTLTLAEAVNACDRLRGGQLVNAAIAELGLHTSLVLGTALITMYGRCGRDDVAASIFDQMDERNLVTWTAAMTSSLDNGRPSRAIALYRQLQLRGLKPNRVSFVAALSACSAATLSAEGRQVYDHAVSAGLDHDAVLRNAAITMFGKCGSVEEARRIFQAAGSNRDLTSWNTMLAALAHSGPTQNDEDQEGEKYSPLQEEATSLIWTMQLEGCRPQSATMVALLGCCCSVTVELDKVLRICVAEVARTSAYDVGLLLNAVLNLYAKSGALDSAVESFARMEGHRDTISWNTMVTACAYHGRTDESLGYFQWMQQEGVPPDQTTLVSVVFACSHAGLVREGCLHFASMVDDYGLEPRMEHFGCLVDMLGRSGRLDEAAEFLAKLRDEGLVVGGEDAVLWTSMLGSCKVQGDSQGAKLASGRVMQLSPRGSSAYVVLSGMNAAR